MGERVSMSMACSANKALDLLEEATDLNRDEAGRKGNLISLDDFGQVVMTGDIHGYRRGFEVLQAFADLKRCPQRHVILHEIIHTSSNGMGATPSEDASFALLLDALAWKVAFPDQIHFMMGNHDLAQWTNREISKSGGASIANFNEWVFRQYGSSGAELLEALNGFIASMPLAVRCPNRVWLSHSLPGPYAMESFDVNVLYRAWRPADLLPDGGVYEVLWGRNQLPEQMDTLARVLDVDTFIVGHQAQPEGYCRVGDRLLILATDHGSGCFVPMDLSRPYTIDELESRIRFLYQAARLQEGRAAAERY